MELEKRPLDEKDREILQFIRKNPSASIAEIAAAEKVRMPIPTVQKRVQRLINEGHLERIMRVVDLRSLGFKEKVRINLKISPHRLQIHEGGPVFVDNPDAKTTSKRNRKTDKVSLYPNPEAVVPTDAQIGTQQALAEFIFSKVAREARPEANFAENLILEDVEVLIGGSEDMTITLHAKDLDTVGEFVVNAILMLGGIQGATTGKVIFSAQETDRRKNQKSTTGKNEIRIMKALRDKFAGKYLDTAERFRLHLTSFSTESAANGFIVDDKPNEAGGWGLQQYPVSVQVPEELLGDGLLLSQIQIRLEEIKAAAQNDGKVAIVVERNRSGQVAITINPPSPEDA